MTRSKNSSHVKITAILLITGLWILFISQMARAQDQGALTLSLRRNFGYSSGTGKIQGNFTAIVKGPDDLVRVVFLIDGEEEASETHEGTSQRQFEMQFNTGDYPLGTHTLSAVGYTADGRVLQSSEQHREFVPAEEGWQAAGKIAIPIISVVFVIMLLSFVLPVVLGRGRRRQVPLGAPRSYGVLGGAICPKCGRPFGVHIWGFNLPTGKLDRCPHCGRWSIVRRANREALHAAEAAELEVAGSNAPPETASPDESIHKELDDSRYRDL